MSNPEPGAELTSRDPEPPEGSIVTAIGRTWEHDGDEYWPACWSSWSGTDGDHQSWIKVAGNYGPAVLVRWGWGEDGT